MDKPVVVDLNLEVGKVWNPVDKSSIKNIGLQQVKLTKNTGVAGLVFEYRVELKIRSTVNCHRMDFYVADGLADTYYLSVYSNGLHVINFKIGVSAVKYYCKIIF